MTTLDIIKILQNDDAELAQEYIDQMGSIEQLYRPKNAGNPVTLAYMAAYFGARKILSSLVKRGADVNFITNGLSIRELCLSKHQSLLGLIEGGIRPDGRELFSLFSSDLRNDVPRDSKLELIDNIIREYQCSTGELSYTDIMKIVRTQAFQKALPHIHDAITGIDTIRLETEISLGEDLKVKFERLLLHAKDEVESLLLSTMKTISVGIQRSIMLVYGSASVFDGAIIRHFRGYRKNKDWLSIAARRARRDISVVLAPTLNLYEDDDDLAMWIDLAILRYPIRERIVGLPEFGTPIIANGKLFEKESARLLSDAGFDVDHIGTTGDQGADIMARKGGLSFAIQCKDYSSPVGNGAVQQALSAKAYYQADYAVVCAPNGFTKSAKSLAATAGVILLTPALLQDLEKLRAMVD